jgi:alpha-ribazole phosphatase
MLLTLIRHGEVEGPLWVFRGHSDAPLSNQGWDSMRASVKALPSTFTRIISSDLKRCREFAEEWSGAIDVPLTVDRRLREIDFGMWEGLAPEDVSARFPTEFAAFRASPETWPGAGGESFAQFETRVADALNHIDGTTPNPHIALVTHGGVIRQIIAMSHQISYAATLQMEVGYASARQVWYERSPAMNRKTKVVECAG